MFRYLKKIFLISTVVLLLWLAKSYYELKTAMDTLGVSSAIETVTSFSSTPEGLDEFLATFLASDADALEISSDQFTELLSAHAEGSILKNLTTSFSGQQIYLNADVELGLLGLSTGTYGVEIAMGFVLENHHLELTVHSLDIESKGEVIQDKLSEGQKRIMQNLVTGVVKNLPLFRKLEQTFSRAEIREDSVILYK